MILSDLLDFLDQKIKILIYSLLINRRQININYIVIIM